MPYDQKRTLIWDSRDLSLKHDSATNELLSFLTKESGIWTLRSHPVASKITVAPNTDIVSVHQKHTVNLKR